MEKLSHQMGIVGKAILAATKPVRYYIDGLLYKNSGKYRDISDFKDIYKGKPLLVIGNGPSLNKTPLNDYTGLPAIGMNKIDMIFERTTWRPSTIVCLNNVVAIQHQDVFAASTIPTFVAWKSRWFLKRKNRQALRYFNVRESNDFVLDPSESFGSSATVTYIALQLAFLTGADPVVIFGVDHSFKYSGEASTYQRRTGDDENHFHPDYFKSGTIWGTPDLDQSEIEYEKAHAAFKKAGRRIYDATVGGKLTIFPKLTVAELNDLLEREKLS